MIKTEIKNNVFLTNENIDEDRGHFRANMAPKPRNCTIDGTILDSLTIYGKIMVKDLYDHVKIVNDEQELQDLAQS